MAAAVRYQAMNSVPENWIPFIPVHVPNNNREIQLQRAAMPRILIGDPNPAAEGAAADFPAAPGTRPRHPHRPISCTKKRCRERAPALSQYYSRSRWTQGQVYTWLRVQKQTGRGEASSGLAFDRLVDKNGVEG